MENPKVSGQRKNLLVAPISAMKMNVKALQEQILNNPEDIDKYIELMKLAMRLGDFNKVVCYAHRALKLKPEHKDVLNILGIAYYKMHNGDDAITTFNKLLDVDASSVKARTNLGLVYMVNKCDPVTAIEHLRAAVKLDEKSEASFVALGQANLKIADFDAALKAFEHAFKLNDKCGQALVGIADAHLGSKDYEAALDYYERALTVEPRCPFAMYGLYHVHERKEDEKKMAEIVKRARAIDTF